jgi:hypothetical protein
VELQKAGDKTISVSRFMPICAPTSPGCLQPRGRAHSTIKAYGEGCRCDAAREALSAYRSTLPPRSKSRTRPARERFMDLVEIDEGEHWRWLGSLNGSGYGNFWFEGSVVRAHLWAFEEWVRAIDDDEILRPHEGCDGERPCVNPKHHIVRERLSNVSQ